MTMNRSIEGFRVLGDHDLAQRQAEIQVEFQKRHGMKDISLAGRLPQIEIAKPEVVLPPLSAETQRFVELMRGDGYAVYGTAGKTLVSLKAEGMRYRYLNPALEERTVLPALLAFKKDPEEFFLPGSFEITHDRQIELIPKEQARVEKKYPGMGLVVREGRLPEWIELAWAHFQATNRQARIFGRDYGDYYTWTDTYKSDQRGADRAIMGSWSGPSGMVVDLDRPDDVCPSLGLASLVEISRK